MSGQGRLRVAVDNPLSAGAVLSSFRLHFLNGDHKIRYLTIKPNGSSYEADFSDGDSNDPFEARAVWLNIPGAVGGTARVSGRTLPSATIPAGPPNTTLVLSGFYIQILAGVDIVKFGIRLDQANLKVEVDLPNDAYSGNTLSEIYYAWVPNSRVGDRGALSGSGPFTRDVSGRLPGRFASGTMITSFNFAFLNGGHHLLKLGVHLSGVPSVDGPLELVSFQDNNTDDPKSWFVEYVEHKAPS